MDTKSVITDELGVNESAFWHISMDLYYGFQPGEVVEVEHESNKYWLATIEYSFRHLVLLKWVGDYGEFWFDTSNINSNSSALSFNESGAPKRLYPPGYHLQSQLKSQFILERPTKFLVRPSLYNPANDPYSEIKTVEDLLAFEQSNISDKFVSNQTSSNNIEPAMLEIAKCKTKIAYGQEDADELETALQNLNELDSLPHDTIESVPYSEKQGDQCGEYIAPQEAPSSSEVHEDSVIGIASEQENNQQQPLDEQHRLGNKNEPETTQENPDQPAKDQASIIELPPERDDVGAECQVDHEAHINTCKSIQESAINKGRYLGLGNHDKEVYYLKPRQLLDVGGANHERILLPGALLEISHSSNDNQSLQLYNWFAVIIKNVGGRLTLRWFLCDEPKFKQGRLEQKSFKSNFVQEDEESIPEDVVPDPDKVDHDQSTKIPAAALTFCLHFCNPRIFSIGYAKSTNRPYRLPSKISNFMQKKLKIDDIELIEKQHIDNVFDSRRMNLDKDRPLIDHLLSTARWLAPNYVNITFAPRDEESRREILYSTPKTTKLFKGFVQRELEPGVFEINSEPQPESGDIVKLIYPFDSSHSILPTQWAVNNQDCLSVDPSRNATPTENNDDNSDFKTSGVIDIQEKKATQVTTDQVEVEFKSDPEPDKDKEPHIKHDIVKIGPFSLHCEIGRAHSTDDCNIDLPNHIDDPNFDTQEPSCWSRFIRHQELMAPKFDCSIHEKHCADVLSKFKVMDQLEVVHPSSDVTICAGRIRKVVFPLLWIQISPDSFTVLPFNSTDIYPHGWCESNNHQLISLLPPRKRIKNSALTSADKKRKKTKTSDCSETNQDVDIEQIAYDKEIFDLGALNDRQTEMDYILNQNTNYVTIYFNHKCFTGPSLSKGKICSLPQYVGPGPLNLVMDEVITRVISVAYVPPRILNDLCSKPFEDLLIRRGLTNNMPMEFKAKYQKRVHRERVQVCINPDDVRLYCECICEHLKCCYNLFGPYLYDGDDCPSHCRALTKSNKYMKRATYYREKARLGEFLGDNNSVKKSPANSLAGGKASRARYAGRSSSDSSSSNVSRSEQINSRPASSNGEDAPVNELKENLAAVEEMNGEVRENLLTTVKQEIDPDQVNTKSELAPIDIQDKIMHLADQEEKINRNPANTSAKLPNDNEFEISNSCPSDWTVVEVAENLERSCLDRFKPYMISEGIDGQALLLLDRSSIREHFLHQKLGYTFDEISKLCRFVDFVRTQAQ